MDSNDLVSFSVEGKVVLVTGGAAGVGAALVRHLLYENAQVVVFIDMAENEGWALQRELWQKYGALRAMYIKCDISDENSFSTAFQHILDKYRRLDIIINNAAVLNTDDDFKRMIDVNFAATVSGTLKGIKTMSESGAGGCILNISSLLALNHTCHVPVYTATKTAVLQFSNAIGMSEHNSKSKVRVVVVCLGPTDTAILQKQNSLNVHTDCAHSMTSWVSVKQRVDSAAIGVMEVIKKGKNGSTWKVADDEPAEDISEVIAQNYNNTWFNKSRD